MTSSYHDYKNQGAYACYDNLNHFIKNFIPDLGCNGAELRAATDRALEMCVWYSGLPDVPLAENPNWPELQDFYRIMKWFINVHNPIGVAIEETWDEMEATEVEEQPPEEKHVNWQDDALDYMSNSEVIVKFTGSKMSLPTLTKLLKDPNNQIRYMRKGRRCKVHIGDFRSYATNHFPTGKAAEKAAEDFLSEIENRKTDERP